MGLMKTRRFLPLFLTQFLGAFNDNLFKNALVMLVTYKLAAQSFISPALLVPLAGAIFILPFFLFSATAGQLCDKMDRARMAQYVKIAEIAFMCLAAMGLMTHHISLMLCVLFCMGVHSTFFGPVKYALLPQHLAPAELVNGNAYVEGGTYLAILLGTIAGGQLAVMQNGTAIVSALAVSVAVVGYFCSRQIPNAPGPAPDIVINRNFWKETTAILSHVRKNTNVFRALLAISWFWFVGALYLSQFFSFAKDYLAGDPGVVTLLLTLFSIGIGAGSALCGKLLKGRVEATYVPLAAIGMAVFGIDLYFASRGGAATSGALQNAWAFMAQPLNWRTLFDLFMIAACGGLFAVPLYALVQKETEPHYMARTIAGLNVLNALFMVVSALFSMVLLELSFTIPQIFLAVALVDVAVALYICQLLPDALIRSVARTVLGWLYRVELKGVENFEAAGDRVLIIANHTSFLDAALIAAYMPVRVTFAINTYIAKAWWMKPFLKIVDAFPVDPTNPLALKSLVEIVRSGKTGMIFPEGRITVTGSLMKVYEGPGLIADKAGAKILPVRIDGAQFTPFSRLKGKVRLRAFPKITITILPPRDFTLPEGIMGRKRRQMAAAQLYDVMSEMMFAASNIDMPLLNGVILASRLYGAHHVIAEDPLRQPVSYRTFISRAFAFGRVLSRTTETTGDGAIPAIGVMLPNMVPTMIAFFGLHSIRKVPAMLNFSAGSAQVLSACQTACIKTVITARRFVTMAKLEGVIAALEEAGIHVVYLEDLKDKVNLADKLYGFAARYAPSALDMLNGKAGAQDPAVILFTSGSEGTPKGVVLSHRNIQANRWQVASRVDFGSTDIVFNCLPMFHSFGLTGGTLLPLLSGIRTFYYPSPLHYRIVPELIYDTNATILFGTDTFLAGYARFAHPYDFHAVRYVFAGAEKLKDDTRRIYAEKYGTRIFEGYGATETAPVISINTPMHHRAGSVGRLMPGVEHALEAVEGIAAQGEAARTGKLMVRGPNVMLGYLKADAPGVLQPPAGGWYDTGDIVARDDDGYISIQGRMKRFAKIAGEMVSLAAVEAALQKVYPEAVHAVVSVKDDKKGEKLILFTTQEGAASEVIGQQFRQAGLSELSVPKHIVHVASLPLLGTGKTDYVRLKTMAEANA